MRKHGWQLPYHPLQVVAVAVFLALGVAFYVFFVPFVGRRFYQRLVLVIYTPLVTSVFCLYIWCAATDPGDPGVFRSKKYLKVVENTNSKNSKESSKEGGSISLKNEENIPDGKKTPSSVMKMDVMEEDLTKESKKNDSSCCSLPHCIVLFAWYPLSFVWKRMCADEQSSEQQSSEDGMFYCSLCEVEVFKYSKHCRVCDKCVDGFDHHCRWLNNCIGKRNYMRFFILIVSALLLLILQWSLGIFVLVRCFLERKQFGVDIALKLGSSFSLLPFIVVVVSCTFLAMVATLPLAQLFFFHILLIKKGLSTYDYIIALREQEQQNAGGQQSPHMSSLSSVTGLSSASSLNTFRRGSWCTPPRLFLEDQFDVIPPDSGSSKRMATDENIIKKNTGSVKINPWTLARLNAEEVSKVAAQARKRSRILQPVMRGKIPEQEIENSFNNSSSRITSKLDTRRQGSKRTNRPPADLSLEAHARISASTTESLSSDMAPAMLRSLAPLQFEARNAFLKSQAMSSVGIVTSPDSSLDSPDLRPFRVSSSGPEESQGLAMATHSLLPSSSAQKGVELSRSTSDGYEASGGEDSDRVPSRIVHRSLNWNSLLFNSSPGDVTNILRAASSTGLQSNSKRLF